MRNILLSLLLTSCMASPLGAAPTVVQAPELHYDAATQSYSMKFPVTSERKRARPDVVWFSKTLIDPILDVTTFGGLNASIRYRYKLISGKSSRQPISHFWMSPIASIDGVEVLPGHKLGELPPMGLPSLLSGSVSERKAKASRLDAVRRLAEDRLEAQSRNAVLPPNQWSHRISYLSQHGGSQLSFAATADATREFLLFPGGELRFEFSSSALPGLIVVPFEGRTTIPLLPSEDVRTDAQTAAYEKWDREDYIPVVTIAPSIERPAQWSVSSLAPLMAGEIAGWPVRKITSTETATRIGAAFALVARAKVEKTSTRDAERDVANLLAALPDVSPPMQQLLSIYVQQLVQAPLVAK